ncbi:MAG: 50S ribosomal protein L22 [Candidatus Moranbacteria bacterium]|jgi:large subunit ribosomal protein L22|nr:50S ribosomal protein L22 [Candidatus Moranbacteria bacterium]
MKVHATLNNLRIAPRKVRLVTHALIGVDTREAVIQLSKMVKKSAEPIATLLGSAVANARNNFGLDEENLYVQAIRVGDGLRLERWLPRAFGRATPLIRRGSNVTIILEERVEGKNRTAKKLPVVKSKELEAAGAEGSENKKETLKVNKPEAKKELARGAQPTGGKVVKKMFQRKSS